MVGSPPRLIACAVAAVAMLGVGPTAASAQALRIVASCRDGYPHGAYELRSASGELRVTGAFNRGKRTSSFLFWSGKGVRIAHVPFDEDERSGTLSLWYEDGPADREPQQKLEAVFSGGLRNGTSRSWYSNGRPRAVLRYERGVLVEAQAWSAAGARLSERAARDQAERDRDEDERYYASLDAIITSHLPRCNAVSPGPRAQASARSDDPSSRRGDHQ